LKPIITTYVAHSRLWASFCMLLLLAGCLTQANQQQEASQIAKQMHAAMQAKDWDAAMGLYGKEFFKGHSRESWKGKLAAMPTRFGELREITESFAQKDPRFGGDFYIYGFKLTYERGVVKETLTIFKKNESDKLVVTGQLFKHKDDVL